MSKITNSPRNRALLAVAGYVVLTVVITLLSSAFLPSSASTPSLKILFALCGPVLALGTHMSIFLWMPLSIPLIALLVMSAVFERIRYLAIFVFLIAWLVIGLYLKDLF
jgi:hypothetical protein